MSDSEKYVFDSPHGLIDLDAELAVFAWGPDLVREIKRLQKENKRLFIKNADNTTKLIDEAIKRPYR